MAGSLPSALTVVASAFTAGPVLSSTTAASILPQSQSPTAIYIFGSGFTYAGQRFKAVASGMATFPSGHTDYSVSMYVLLGGATKIGNTNLFSNNVVAPGTNYTTISAFGQQGQQISLVETTPASPVSWLYEMWGTTISSGASGTLGWSSRMTMTMYLNPERLLLAPVQFVTVSSGNATAAFNDAASLTFDLFAGFTNVTAGPTLQLQDYELSTTV